MGSVQYGLSVKQAHTHSHALQSCRFPVGGFHPQGTETELLRRRVNQPPRTAVSPGGCGRPRWEPGMDAAGDKRDSAGSLIFPLFFGLCWVCIARWLFSSCGKQDHSLDAEHKLLIAVAPPVAEHGLRGPWASEAVAHGLSCPIWNLPRPGMRLVSLHWQEDSQQRSHQRSRIPLFLICPICLLFFFSFLLCN